MSEDLIAIAARRQLWVEAVNERNVHLYCDVVTEDLVWFPPGQSAISGRRAFAAWVRPFFEGFHYEFALRSVDVQVAGDWGVERGEFQTSMTSTSSGEVGEHQGKYLVFWRRCADHLWRIERYLDETLTHTKQP